MTKEIRGWAAFEQGERIRPYTYSSGELGEQECLLRVISCGICHSDLHMLDNDWRMSRYPLIPGHEVVGEVVEVGKHIHHLKPGMRVGVGWQRSACLSCSTCLEGNENLCDEQQGLITNGHGGFADHLVVDAHFAFPLTDGLSDQHTGPLLCGGVTAYSALHYAGMTSGQHIGVIGIGGLGHLAVQFAARLGNKVTVFTTSEDKASFASELGAHDAIVVPRGESPTAPKQPLDILLNTVPATLDWASYLELLKADGTFTLVAGPGKLTLPFPALMSKRRRVMGSVIGGRAIMTKMLEVADTFGIEPVIETFAFEDVNEALQKVKENTIRYRAVLTASA